MQQFEAWIVCRSLDAALVSPGEPIPFPNARTKPDLSKGMAYNLANNIWGTNYIMWQPYEQEQERMRFRFLLQMTKAESRSERPDLWQSLTKPVSTA